MARYIDLEEFERRINKYVKPVNPDEKELVEWCRDECIRQGYCMPTADVVEVVRCKNCSKWEKYENTSGAGYCHNKNFCFAYGMNNTHKFTPITMPDDFCSCGERKE